MKILIYLIIQVEMYMYLYYLCNIISRPIFRICNLESVNSQSMSVFPNNNRNKTSSLPPNLSSTRFILFIFNIRVEQNNEQKFYLMNEQFIAFLE